MSASRSVDVLPDGAFGLLMDALAEVLPVVLINYLTDIGVDVLVNVNANVFAGAMSVKFVMPAPSDGFSCSAAFGLSSTVPVVCSSGCPRATCDHV